MKNRKVWIIAAVTLGFFVIIGTALAFEWPWARDKPVKSPAQELTIDTKLEAVISAVDCMTSFNEFKKIREQYLTKKRICDYADSWEELEKQETIFADKLGLLMHDPAIDPNDQEWKTKCGEFLTGKAKAARLAASVASTNKINYTHQCEDSSEGPTLASLASMTDEGRGIVCKKCDYRWPEPPSWGYPDECAFMREIPDSSVFR